MVKLDNHVAMQDLGIAERLGKVVDPGAGHAGGLQLFQPFGGGAGFQFFGDQAFDMGLNLEPLGCRRVGRVAQLIDVHNIEKRRPKGIADDGNGDAVVGRRKRVVGRVHEMAVADGLGNVTRHQVHGGHVVEQADLHIEHGNVHMLANAGALSGQQRRLNAHDREHAAAQIADGDSGAHAPARPLAGDRHAAAEALDDLIERGPLVAWAVFAESGDRASDDLRVFRGEALVVDVQAPGNAGGKVVEHHIRVAHQFIKEMEPCWRLQVDGHGTLVAIQGEKVGAHAANGIARVVLKQPPRPLAPAGRLDFHRIAAEIGQDHPRIGPGHHVREVDEADASQRLGCGKLSHWAVGWESMPDYTVRPYPCLSHYPVAPSFCTARRRPKLPASSRQATAVKAVKDEWKPPLKS